MPKECPSCNAMNEDLAAICDNCQTPFPVERGIVKKKKESKAVITGALSVSPKSIELLDLKRSEVKETYLLLSRADFESEQFSGVVTPPNIPGFNVKADSFEGLRNVINIQIDAKQLKAGEVYQGYIGIKSDVGDAQIPVKLSISADSPQLGINYNQIQINMNSKETTANFAVQNIGYGTLTGNVKTKTPWLSIEDPTFALEKDGTAEIEVSLDKSELKKFDRAGRMTLEGLVTLESNAGDEEIKVILYLPPVHSLADYKPYIPHAIVGVIIILVVVLAYKPIKQFLTPAAIPKTGLWGEMEGKSGSKKLTELQWNPFSEDTKIVFTSVSGNKGRLDQVKMSTRKIETIYDSQIDRLYIPAIAPNGFLLAIGLPGEKTQLTDKKQNKFLDLTIVNVNKLKPDRITAYGPPEEKIALAYDPAWSPDGKHLAFIKTSSADSLHGELLLVDYDNATPYSISDFPKQGINLLCKEPKWSPDGNKIVVEDLKKEIHIFEPQGRDKPPIVLKLTNMEEFDSFDPQWSPDAKKIVFSRNDGEDKGDIYLIKSDGTGLIPLIKRPSFEDKNPQYSPDGNYIIFDSKEYGAGNLRDIYIVSANGDGLKNLTNSEDIDEEAASWSPDGKKIAFRGQEDKEDWEIYLLDPSMSGEKDYTPLNLTDDDADQGVPLWWTAEFYNMELKLNQAKDSK